MFDPVDPKQSFPDLERGILRYWQEEDIFKRSIRARSRKAGDPLEAGTCIEETRFSFYDGPPFATGLPHYGHLLAGTIKDVIPRYQTMRGKRVERRFGWDCHGLPVEYEIEKEFNIQSKKQIEEMGVAAFNALCRSAVLRYTKEWRATVERMGRFVDMDWDYRTMDPDYMESIWWVFAELYRKGLIYEGHKPMHICPRCVTPLSNFEVTQGYKEVTDHSVFVQFELIDEKELRIKNLESRKVFVLAWTTTPWTLPGNLFLAVGKDILYAKVKFDGKVFIVAENRTEHVFNKKEHEVIGTINGTELIGKKYKPLFPYFVEAYKDKAFRIVDGSDFVMTEEGTGVVHIAPGFGEDDYNIGKKEGVPVLQHVTMDGKFIPAVADFAGMDVKPKDEPSKTDTFIAKYLKEKGSLFDRQNYVHTYPHCWRCDSPLLNYATSSWFVAVEKIKQDMLRANSMTEWMPSHVRDGRFGKWIEGARDWAISRSRYWGTPLPIWRSELDGSIEIIDSRNELIGKAPQRFTKLTVLRHGESDGNVIPIYQCTVPGTNLTEQGRRQAEATAARLKESNVTCIYASPLARTLQTAEIIAKATGAKLVIDERLREVAFGEFDGKSVDFSDLTLVKERRTHKLETQKVENIYHFPGMETWSQVQERITDFMRDVLPKHQGDHIVVVTHADPLLNIRHFFSREEPAKLCNQPYPIFADPSAFTYDHTTKTELDLHKETVDGISWDATTDDDQAVHLSVMRHGESDWNAEKKIAGSSDRPLSNRGKEQAEEAAKKLLSSDFDVIICSTLQRSKKTAEIIGNVWKMPVESIPIFVEQNLGDWEGKTEEEIHHEYPDYPENFLADINDVPHGEHRPVFYQRVRDGLVYLRKHYKGKRVLLVTHRRWINALNFFTNGGDECRSLDNAEVEQYTLRPQFVRIPDVLDCWFESGSMPYAQQHFPFEASSFRTQAESNLPKNFPADFIAEGLDQTRGWFYTLMVLSTALFNLPAFRHCVVNGTVLTEDGKKMSKRLKNYPEPLVVVEKHGADAVRFALMKSPAVRGEDLRFSERVTEETVRSLILPLWNTYSFFVTYANAANWSPAESRTPSRHPLDRWIRADVQDLCNRMTNELERYDLSATCDELESTIDALTNWYVRLSRRRFAAKSGYHAHGATTLEESQRDALKTLYDVLLTLSQLLAPFCPFIADAIYLNLVPEEHGSVHLSDWPKQRTLSEEETLLLEQTRMLRTICSLGLRIRSEKRIRVRQPLLQAIVVLPPQLSSLLADRSALEILQEELNVREIKFMEDPKGLADAIAQVDAKKVGPRLGGRVQELIKAGKAGEFTIHEDGSVEILGEKLDKTEVQIQYRGKQGHEVASAKGIVVALDTTLTESLTKEGDARELIRAIQKLRKELDFQITDKVTIELNGSDDLEQFYDRIAEETNTIFTKVSNGEEYPLDIEGKNIKAIVSL